MRCTIQQVKIKGEVTKKKLKYIYNFSYSKRTGRQISFWEEALTLLLGKTLENTAQIKAQYKPLPQWRLIVIYSFMCHNQPFWPRLKVFLLYFAHANEVRKAYYHTNKRILFFFLIKEYINRPPLWKRSVYLGAPGWGLNAAIIGWTMANAMATIPTYECGPAFCII